MFKNSLTNQLSVVRSLNQRLKASNINHTVSIKNINHADKNIVLLFNYNLNRGGDYEFDLQILTGIEQSLLISLEDVLGVTLYEHESTVVELEDSDESSAILLLKISVAILNSDWIDTLFDIIE